MHTAYGRGRTDRGFVAIAAPVLLLLSSSLLLLSMRHAVRFEERDTPQLHAATVSLQVHACGRCFDLPWPSPQYMYVYAHAHITSITCSICGSCVYQYGWWTKSPFLTALRHADNATTLPLSKCRIWLLFYYPCSDCPVAICVFELDICLCILYTSSRDGVSGSIR